MQKDLLKLALTGLTAGLCLSAQGGGNEIAMSKCSKTPKATEDQKSNGEDPSDDLYDADIDEGPNCASQGNSCATGGGNQGDQSTYNRPTPTQNYIEIKRLSAAKTAMGEERLPGMDK